MILGMTTATFTLLHVLISLLGIGSGLIVMYGLLTANRLNHWTMLFLTSTALTSITGFLFPNEHITPGIVVGILSLLVLAVGVVARYPQRLRGAWRPIYVISASLALYFNVFVLVVQLFEKVPTLRALAPTQNEPPFGITQLLLLILFIVATVYAVKRFHPSAGIGNSVAGSTQKRAA
jgi:hypothetical protein